MYGINVWHNRVVRCSFRCYSNNSTKKLLEFLAEMPKAHTARINEAQRQRQHIAKKSHRYPPSNVYLQVLGSGARGAPNTLYLFTDQKRYLFNCGECTQRLAHEHKVKLSRLENIFITGKSWKNIGGLPGLSLTLQDVGVPKITLHGPEGLDELYNATKRFVIMKEMNVTMAKCTPSDDFEDNTMTVKYVLLGPHDNLLEKEPKPAIKKAKLDTPDFEEFVHDDTDYYKRDIKPSETPQNKTREKIKPKLTTDTQQKKTEKVLYDLQKKSHCTVAFICTLKKRMGTLDLAKCVERGIKPGPLLGQLKNGHNVVLPDGNLVLSRDVKTPDDPGPVFIVMEVPELSYLKESEFAAHFDNGENPPENVPALVVHYTPPDVFNHPQYRHFMSMFGSNTRHLVLNSQNTCLGSEAVHRTQHKLHLLDVDIFPMLRDASIPAVWTSHSVPDKDNPAKRGLEDLKNKIALAQFQNIINLEGSNGQVHADDGSDVEIIAGRTLTMFHLRPKRQIDRSAEPKLHIQNYIEETMEVDGFVSSLEQFRRLIDKVRYAKSNSHMEYPKVVFLGTGSCIPSKTRNTSGIALQIDENRSMILDCGEGTFGQLVRFFGPKKVNAFLRTIKAIYVSHLHADHHIGLIGVIQARCEAFEAVGLTPEPVYLLAPGQIYTWLSTYNQQFERIKSDFTLIPNQSLLDSAEPEPHQELSPAALAAIGLQQVRTCLVSHCPNAFGVALQLDDRHKLTYSGDTIPCDALVTIGENSTLLIHEATMEDELVQEARTKMHSTTSQAIEVGRQMNARYTVLTHFSQRYARLPRLNASILNDNNSVGIAFDNMQITLSDLELLPHMYAPLQLMFAEHCVEMEVKAAHRARHKERERQNRWNSSPNMPVGRTTGSVSGRTATRSRKVSPAWSSPVHQQATYRESNSSRLRQELKGMQVSGLIRKEPRSLSHSPMKRTSTNSSPTRADFSISSPPSRRCSEKTISSARTTSETSTRTNAKGSRLVDTRSKTLVDQTGCTERDSSNIPRKCPLESPKLSIGHEKPFTTSLFEKLANKTDNISVQETITTESCSVKYPIVCRARSPVRQWKVERSASFPENDPAPNLLISRLVTYRADVISSVLIHITLWRLAHVTYYLVFYTGPITMVIVAVAALFWTANKEWDLTGRGASITSQSARNTRSLVGSPGSVVKPVRRPISSLVSQQKYHSQSMSSTKVAKLLRSTQPPPPHLADKTEEPADSQSEQLKTDQNGTKNRPSSSKKPSKIPMSIRNTSTEKLKEQFCRDTPLAAGRFCNSHNGSTKSFKPQLEDIKSSFFLLNKKHAEATKEPLQENEKPQIKMKPRVIDENQRKELLESAMKKFQTKQFFADASLYSTSQ